MGGGLSMSLVIARGLTVTFWGYLLMKVYQAMVIMYPCEHSVHVYIIDHKIIMSSCKVVFRTYRPP